MEQCFQQQQTTDSSHKIFMSDQQRSKKLKSRNKINVFHSVVAKLLYLAKRSRPDVDPTVAFLCTPLSCPNMDDWKIKKTNIIFTKHN